MIPSWTFFFKYIVFHSSAVLVGIMLHVQLKNNISLSSFISVNYIRSADVIIYTGKIGQVIIGKIGE